MPRYPQAILVSCEVPWDENEELLENVFRKELQFVLEQFNHLYIFGTAGEGHAVDTRQFTQIAKIFFEETLGNPNLTDIHPMVGVIGLSTANVKERLKIAYDIGFRIIQISLPSWGALSDAELTRFFKDTCGFFSDCQFLHYNLPRTKRVLRGADYAQLIQDVPNLVATKNTGGGLHKVSDLLKHVPELQHFFSEEGYANGCLISECSVLSAFGPTTPHKIKDLFEAGKTKDVKKLSQLQHGFHNLLHDVLGPLLSQGKMDGAYDKVLKRLGGLEEMPLRLLSPYEGFSEEDYKETKKRFYDQFPEWVADMR